jgi:hypothetical protein
VSYQPIFRRSSILKALFDRDNMDSVIRTEINNSIVNWWFASRISSVGTQNIADLRKSEPNPVVKWVQKSSDIYDWLKCKDFDYIASADLYVKPIFVSSTWDEAIQTCLKLAPSSHLLVLNSLDEFQQLQNYTSHLPGIFILRIKTQLFHFFVVVLLN